MTGSWEFAFSCNNEWSFPYEFRQRFGTSRRPAIEILLRTLNQQSVTVTDSVSSSHTKSGKQSVINKNETVLAMEKQKLLIEEFQKWIWTDKNRKKRLEQIYEEKYASVKQRHFDGSFLEMPGLDSAVSLYPYQKNAVARIIFSPNTLLAHDVGSGKTFIMIAAGMELKRLKMSAKNLYVVPNNLVGQWRHIFYTMYPSAYIKCIEPKDFSPTKSVSNILNQINGNIDKCFSLISGLIGIGQAAELRTWSKVYKDLPSVYDIFLGKACDVPQKPDSLYALTSAMTAYAGEHRDNLQMIANSISYANKLPPDFAVVLMKDYMSIEKDYAKKLMKIPEFSRWMQKKGSLLNGSI